MKIVEFRINERRNKRLHKNCRNNYWVRCFDIGNFDFRYIRFNKIFCNIDIISCVNNCIYSNSCSTSNREDRGASENKGDGIIMPSESKKGSFKWGDYLLYILIATLIYLFLKSQGIVP